MSVYQIILKAYLLIDKEHNYLMDDEGLKDENAFMLLYLMIVIISKTLRQLVVRQRNCLL